MDSHLKPSEWARQHKDKCLESGDVDSAMDYFEMEQLWEGRGQ